MKRLLLLLALASPLGAQVQLGKNVQIGANATAGFITSLTTTGSSGAATVTSGVLNIPNYTFSFTLGSTPITNGNTITAVTGLSVNGVTLNAAGSTSLFLNQAGSYSAPAGGVSGSGTTGFIPLWSGAAALGNSHLDDGVTAAATITASEPVSINDGSGKAGSIGLLAGTAPSAAPANTIQINAPASVTAYAINLPGAQPTAGNTRLDCTAANPAVCTWAASAGGTVTAVTGTAPIVSSGGTAPAISCATCTVTIASGTSALGTGAIASATCATVVTTTATGVASTDAIIWNPNGSIKAVTGYVPATSGGLTIAPYPTTNAVNFDVCNWTSASITPGAVTLNWRVVR